MGDSAARGAAFFDLDRTLVARSSSLAFARRFHRRGLLTRRDVVHASYAQIVYLLVGADHNRMQRLRRRASEVVTGWPVAEVEDIVRGSLGEIIEPMLYPQSLPLIAEHRQAGRDIVIISSSGTALVGPVGEFLGADVSIGTELEVVRGRYTGRVLFYAYGEGKAEAMRRLAATREYDLNTSFAYSDSHTDLPMLAAVGHPVATNPDARLRRIAAQRGWPVVQFTSPGQLRSPLRHPDRRTAAAAAIAGAVVVGVARRRRWGWAGPSRAGQGPIPAPVAPNG